MWRGRETVTFLAGLLTLVLTALDCSATTDTSRPNIVVMLMDDMGWGDLGCNGNPADETPYLDQMAREGARLTDFYAGAPVCSPSRAALLTGRLPLRTGFYTTNAHARNSYAHQRVVGGIPKDEQLVSELLQPGGYRTKAVGKWHLGHQADHLPLKHGFHEFLGSAITHPKDTPRPPMFRDDKMIGRFYEDFPITDEGESNITQLYIKEAEDFLDDQHAQGRPFFLYWAPDATHDPVYVSRRFLGRSVRGRYGDAIMELDSGVGRILQKLRDLGIANNTFVFFTSDNGAALLLGEKAGSNGPLLCGKTTTFEGGMREPAIAWWPGTIPPRRVVKVPLTIMDIFSTSLAIAGVQQPKDRFIDGINMLPALTGDHFDINSEVFYYRGAELMAVRVHHYKAQLWTWASGAGREQGANACPGQYLVNMTTKFQENHTALPLLYHLGRDPGEKYQINPSAAEYQRVMPVLQETVERHRRHLDTRKPLFNTCDNHVALWAPAGCDMVNSCLKAPPSKPYRCGWTI